MSEIKVSDFLNISYDELRELNTAAKERIKNRMSEQELKEIYTTYLKNEKQLKAVTVCFSDLEGRFHMLDYDKEFLLKSHENLTFDGSSVRGFSGVEQSDLRLSIDWGSLRWLPAQVFGSGKVIVFGMILDEQSQPYQSDMRGRLKAFTDKLYTEKGQVANLSVEIEGFLFDGINSEQNFSSREGFSFVSTGGYYHSLPQDELRLFIDALADAKRAMGFENEKDHPEVAPSQFELNYSYCDALIAADQIQIYKLLARQIAASMGFTASFLPKPVANINGNGMHTNLSISENGKNIFYDPNGEDGLSKFAWDFVDKILHNANELCLLMNSSVNAYRRLDPAFEAPNQIKASAIDRTSMVRVPLANEKSARIEVRTVSPDAPPYLTFLSILGTGLEGPSAEASDEENRRTRTRILPGNVNDAIRHFKSSTFLREFLGEDVQAKYSSLKQASADRCPKELGTMVKTEEILFHHEVTNQFIWSRF